MRYRILAIALTVGLAACGGGSGAPTSPNIAPQQPAAAQSLVPTSFAVGVPGTTSAAKARLPQYVGAGAQSVTITLNTVNGNAPPVGLTTSVTSSLTLPCPCTVGGPFVPPGSDAFTFTTYDAVNGGGNVLATTTGTYSIVAGAANGGNVATLLGVPKTFSISGVPAATAGTAFGSPAALTLAVKDADGNTITGTYSVPVTVTDSDVSGTQGSQLAVNAGSASSSVSVTKSSDVVTLAYGGRAIAAATLTAAASGATNGTATFTPMLSPIVYSGPLNGATPEIDLYAPSGTGSTGSFTASEAGLTNAPYNGTLSATAVPCSSIGTIAEGSANSFTFTAIASPSSGSCTITVSDGLGQIKAVTGTYTTSGFGVN